MKMIENENYTLVNDRKRRCQIC